jgi:hypothetical protein
MHTKRFWGPSNPDRRGEERRPATFYVVELASDGSRYLRRTLNVSRKGLVLENRLGTERPGSLLELEVPREETSPMRVRAEVVHLLASGQYAVRAVDGQTFDDAGGAIRL